MAHDNLKITGALTIAKNGKVVREVNNLVVTSGLTWLAGRMATGAGTDMGYIEIGTGNSATSIGTAPVAADTALETAAGTGARQTTAITTSTTDVVFVGVWAAGEGTSGAAVNGGISEAGIFDTASTGGIMLARTVFQEIFKGASDSLTITWTISIAAS
jgi:hypothetical protein